MSHTKRERYCTFLYNVLLKEVIKPVTGDKTTYSDGILRIGKKMLGDKFNGVYPSDQIPKLNEESPYAILDFDTSEEKGSHWVAIAKKGDKTYMYDSFGRKDTEIIANLQFSRNGRIMNTDDDSEQKITQRDCGPRSLAFLVFFDRWGAEYAMLI